MQYPSWSKKILPSETSWWSAEMSTIDLPRKRMLVRTQNVTYSNLITVNERLCYEAKPDESKTLLKHEVTVSVKGHLLPSSLFENFIVSTISAGVGNRREQIEFVIADLNLGMSG